MAASPGKVYLIGAGPGDPGLITVRGRDLLRAADIVFYDNLAAPDLLIEAPRARKIYVGKKRAAHAHTQDEINRMLVTEAQAGRIVARLKGGDPYVFGRGGEEAEALAAAGVPFEVVPGVSSAVGAAAYAGIPLTHREFTPAVTFVTGHEVDRIDWTKLGVAETLVVFMGLTACGEIARCLIAAGRSPATPAAAVRWATRPCQQTIVGTLADLADRIAAAKMKPPALLIIGEVAGLRERLDWYERLPLFGQRIVVTRAREQASELSERLRRLGADPVELPAIEIRPPGDWGPLDAAIARLETYDWLIFTSQNGVARFVERLDRSDKDWRALRARIAAIGPATAQALRDLYLKVDLLPEKYVAEAVLEALGGQELTGRRILIPRAAEARDVLPRELRARGAEVDVTPAYQTTAPEDLPARAHDAFADPPDWITFTSSSTVKNLVGAVGAEKLARSRIASIGPITSGTARDYGLPVAVEANDYTVEGLLAALEAWPAT